MYGRTDADPTYVYVLMEENEDMVSWALSHFDCLTLVSQVSVSGTASSF